VADVIPVLDVVQKPMRRTLLALFVALPLGACNTAQTVDGTSVAVIETGRPAAPAVRRAVRSEAGRHFIEFRSRYAVSYGHTFVVHGRLNARGEVGPLSAANVAGFHPAGAGPELWTAGHLVPVPAETGPSDGDLEEQYVSARFRVYLTAEQYENLAAHIRAKQASSAVR
jgi:hypothetical protein